MINPVNRGNEWLEFKCDCGEIFHHAKEIVHDASVKNEAQRYDVRNWIIMRINLECPECRKTDSLKLQL
jgi:hypothetical protein